MSGVDILERLRGVSPVNACGERSMAALAADEIKSLRAALDAAEQRAVEARDEGATETIKMLAKWLGVTEWEGGDGTETWEGDVSVEIGNVLKAADVYEDENGTLATLAQLATARALMAPQWQPIETVQDCFPRWIFHPVYGQGCAFKDITGEWHWMNQKPLVTAPTHWMPLPAAPKPEDTTDAG